MQHAVLHKLATSVFLALAVECGRQVSLFILLASSLMDLLTVLEHPASDTSCRVFVPLGGELSGGSWSAWVEGIHDKEIFCFLHFSEDSHN